MMRAVVTSGTAAGIGLGAGVYAQDRDRRHPGPGAAQQLAVAFDPTQDIAVACLVLTPATALGGRPRSSVLPQPLLERALQLMKRQMTDRIQADRTL